MGSYKRGSGTSPDVHSKWSHLVLIVVEYFGQQRSLNRECVRTLRKDWVILHGSSMICMYHYLRQSPRYRASWCFRGKFDWLVLGDSLEIESVVLIEDALFCLSEMYFRIISILLRMEAVALVLWTRKDTLLNCRNLRRKELWKARVSCWETQETEVDKINSGSNWWPWQGKERGAVRIEPWEP